MSQDRFIKLPSVLSPAERREVEYTLEDYAAGVGTVRWCRDRWYLTLLGKPSYPYKRCLDADPRAQAMCETHEERWIEIWLDRTALSVITRCQDPLTCAIAAGLHKLLRFRLTGDTGEKACD